MNKHIERAEMDKVNPFSAQPAMQRYVFASQYIENKIVLDIACGIGYGCNIMKNKYPSAFVIGADNYFNGLKYGRDVFEKGIKFCQLDALHLPFKDSTFDIVVSMETVEHLSDLNGFLREIYRILNDGGIFVCSTPNKHFTERIGAEKDNPFHLKEYIKDEMLDILSNFFHEVESYGQASTASDFMYKFPNSYRILKFIHNIIAPIIRKNDPKVYSVKTLNPKFEVKKFWPESRTMVFVSKKIIKSIT